MVQRFTKFQQSIVDEQNARRKKKKNTPQAYTNIIIHIQNVTMEGFWKAVVIVGSPIVNTIVNNTVNKNMI